ncbi:anti-sigma factor family protein [Bordetella genomosp. 13]|uniref:anti-sigma factor family protein n=1 Tax=Bordetella genomosp. 13 TaxID=463040 RepID=UPI0011A327F5|nr:anti-sigma factor [Bordetella genomosp. 13]
MSDETLRAVPATGTPITEADLHAYADGQLPEARRAGVAALLAQQPEARARVDGWRRQNEALREFLDPVLDEPLPLRLPLAPPRRPSAFAGRWGVLAAGLAVAVVSACAAWFVRGAVDARQAGAVPAVAQGADGTSFARRAAVAHAVYAADVRRPVEVGADQQQALVTWLTKRLGASVKAPALGGLGYELVGGRLLPGGQGPVAQFMYTATDGQRLTLYVTREAAGDQTAFRFTQDGAVRVFYWVEGSFGYALSGEVDRATLQRVADEVYKQLS